MSNRTASRRNFAALPATLLLPAAAAGSDRVLIAKVETFVAGLMEERTLLADLSDEERTTVYAYRRRLAWKGKLTPLDRQAVAIAKLPARTPEGLRAKAKAAAWNAGGDDTVLPRILIADDLLGSLLADLTGLSRTTKGPRA